MPTAYAARRAEPHLMAEINTTPIIDVMLVLLVMMLLSLPAPTHKAAVDLPQAGATAQTPRPVHEVTLDARGATFWDGNAVDGQALATRLAAMPTDPAKPVLHIRTDAQTPYAQFDALIIAVKRAGIEEVGFKGNDAFRTF